MSDDGVQRAQRGSPVGAPVVDVGVLPPPEGLERPARLVVLQPMDQVGGHGGEVVGKPERGRPGVRVRVEKLAVLVAIAQPGGQADPELVKVGIGADVGLPVARRDHVLAGAELSPGEQDLRHLEQQQRHDLIAALPVGERPHPVKKIPRLSGDPLGERVPAIPGAVLPQPPGRCARHQAASVLRTRGRGSPHPRTPGPPRPGAHWLALSPAAPAASPNGPDK